MKLKKYVRVGLLVNKVFVIQTWRICLYDNNLHSLRVDFVEAYLY